MAREPIRQAEHKDESDRKDKPEQFAHGAIAITGAQVGTTIDTNGNIIEILYTGAPTAYEVPTFDPATGLPLTGYFCLIDKPATGPFIRLYNFSGHHGAVGAPHPKNKKMTGVVGVSSIPFNSLYVQSVPVGATFQVTTA